MFSEDHMELCRMVAGQMVRRDPDLRKDAAQAAAVSVWLMLQRHACPSPELIAVTARRGVMNELRRHYRHLSAEHLQPEMRDEEHDPWPDIDGRLSFEAAMGMVTDRRERMYLRLRHQYGFNHVAACRVVRVNRETPKARWARTSGLLQREWADA